MDNILNKLQKAYRFRDIRLAVLFGSYSIFDALSSNVDIRVLEKKLFQELNENIVSKQLKS